MVSPASDVLVVGSGPAGLVCALSLAQNGVRVRIIDKLTEPPVGQRGSGISPRTLELYKFLGVLEDIKKRGREARGVQPYGTDGKPLPPRRVMPRRDPTPGVPEPNFWTVGQDDACAVLREHLKTYDVSVEFGTELVGFEQDETGVTVSLEYTEDGKEESARVKFLVGADGGRSSVRKLAGIQFIGESSPEYTRITGEVELTGLSGDFMHIFNSVDKAMIMTREVYQKPPQFYVYISGCDTTRALEDVEYLQQHFAQVTQNPGIKVHKIIQLREWRLNVRMAERFRDGRVFLAGDAGHVHSPTGGQGMNSGLQDSMNLAWKLALVCKNLASISLLQTYDEERQPVIREMLRISVGIFNRNQEPQRRGDEQQNAPGALRQLGVNYRWSSIVVDELQIDDPDLSSALEPINSYGSDEPDRLHAGDRAPDATSLVKIKDESRTTLFGLFRSARHAVLVFDLALADSIYSITAKWGDIVSVIVIQQPDAARDTRDEVFVDMEGHAARAYFVEAGVRAVVVRPDGVVGALARTSDVVAKYFSKVLL